MGKVVEADFSGASFEPTDDLDAVGWQKWNELAERAKLSGIANAADLFTCYCQYFAKRKRCEAEIQDDGLTMVSIKGGQRSHPLNQVSIQLTIELRQLSKALGFDQAKDAQPDNQKETQARRLLD